jgi:hypothetical protein
MLIGTVALAAGGVVEVLSRLRGNPWWRFVLYGTVVAPLPSALTVDRFHTLRLSALPIFLLVLAVPAVRWMWRGEERRELRRAPLLCSSA